MQTFGLLTELEFFEEGDRAHAQALHADHNGRALRWTLQPGQSVQPSTSPSTPVYLVVLQGSGYFAGQDGVERKLAPNDMAVFAPNELHTARAEDENLIFIAILHEAPNPAHGH